MEILLIFALFIIAPILGAFAQIAWEEKLQFNKGTCVTCGKRLTQVPFELKRGRGYWCDCGNVVFVEFKSTDKKFLKELEKENEK